MQVDAAIYSVFHRAGRERKSLVVNAMDEGRDSRDFKPEGWPTVIARIVVPEAEEFVEFVKSVFQATGDYHSDRPAVLNIGGSLLMISDAGIRERATAFL